MSFRRRVHVSSRLMLVYVISKILHGTILILVFLAGSVTPRYPIQHCVCRHFHRRLSPITIFRPLAAVEV